MRTVSLGVAQDLGCSSLTLDWTLELAPGGASHAIMKEKRGRHVGFLDQESVLLWELRNATKEERTCAHAQKGNQATECGIQPKKGQPALPKQRCGKRQGPDRNRAVVKHTRPSLPSFFFPVEEERKDLTPPPPLWMEMESSSGNDAAKPDASAGATAAGSAGIGVSGAPANSGDGGVPASRNATQQELPQQQQQQHQQQQQQQQQSQHQQQVYATQGPAAINSAKTNVRGGAAAGDGNGKKGKTVAAKRNGKSGEPTGIGMPKKPSPRARTPKASKAAEGGETGAGKKKMTAAEKKKAAALAAQSGAQTTNDKPGATMGASVAVNGSQMSTNTPELLPVHDNELRKSYLQQVYRQLLITHRNQDDNIIRQVATNIEMEVCRKATSRNEYIGTLNYEINKLMQKELSNGSAATGNSAYSNANAQAPGLHSDGYRNSESVAAASSETSAAKSPPAQSRLSEYGESQPQAQMRAQGQSHSQGPGSTPTQPSEGSFMQSLLSDQNPVATYAQSKGHQQPGASVYSAASTASQHGSQDHSGLPSAHHGYPQNIHTQNPPDIHMQQAYQLQQQQQRQSRPLSPAATLPEFAAQVQHFDKNALIELLWNQRNSLIQWQRRASQLEATLNARYQSGTSAVSSHYNSTPPGMQTYGSSVPPNVSAEAELQRANERRNARIVQQQHQQQQQQRQQQQQYPVQPSHYAGGNTSSPMSGTTSGLGAPVSPMVYWEKVRALKSAYSQDLYLAHRALSQHNAPPNSTQSIKAENVKHNISLAMNVLNEPAKNIQPRPFEVLISIERFIHNTIIPIVQKVGPGISAQQSNPAGVPSGYHNSRSSMSLSHPAGTEGAPRPSGGRFTQDNAMQQVNSMAAQTAGQDGSSGAGRGKKSKSDPVGTQRMPQSHARSKQSGASSEGKSTAKNANKMNETKPVAQPNSNQAVRTSDGHQSPFGTGVSAIEKMATPTVSPSENRMMATAEDSAKAIGIDAASKNMSEDAEDDALNDFSDFPELDFDEEMPSMKVQFNKENNSYNAKKRSVEDV